MIGSLRGTLQAKTETQLILDVGGVGYELSCPTGVIADAQSGKELQLFVHTHVREDEIALFGFASLDDREFFRKLTSVSGIGPKIGLELLSAPQQMIKEAILEGDSAVLSKVKGIGKKTAERLILELRGKIEMPISMKSEGKPVQEGEKKSREDAVEALMGLGYDRYEVVKRLHDAPGGLSTEEFVRFFLTHG